VSEVRIAAEPRSEFGKGAARRIRRSAKVPAVLYGHGTAPRHITLPGHDLMLALKTPNVLLALDIEGASELALPKDVQRDPVRGHLEHVDLVLVRRGEKVVVDVSVTVVGEPAPGTLVTVDQQTVQVETEATHIPTEIQVDVAGLAAGAQVLASQLTLPAGTTLALDPEALVLAVTAQQTEAQADAELAGLEAGAGIVHQEKSEDAATGDASA
jgi:large subunit ribosomal protein L25